MTQNFRLWVNNFHLLLPPLEAGAWSVEIGDSARRGNLSHHRADDGKGAGHTVHFTPKFRQ